MDFTYGLAKPDKTIEEHTKETLKAFEDILKIYGNKFSEIEKELIKLAIKYHDYGKMNRLFQEKIRLKKRVSGEIYHNFLSPFFLSGVKEDLIEKYGNENGNFYYNIICTAIYYHHVRTENFTDKGLVDYVKENIINFLPDNSFYKVDIENFIRNKNLLFTKNTFKASSNFLDIYVKYALIKGMLNKCDYVSSSGQIPEIEANQNSNYLYENIDKKFTNLTEAQKFMKENSNNNIILIAPTGSGKTEASLFWLGSSKGFYTLPLKVASNAIYERIYYNYHYPNVSLLHSDALEDIVKNNDFEDGYKMYKETKLFSYPLTICTIDQIFKFPFKAVGTEIMLSTLAYSKIIIDEVQMYSSTILATIIVGLKMVIEAGGNFAITTATIPKFFRTLINREIGEKNYIYKEFLNTNLSERHKIRLIDNDFDYEKIIESARTKKVLVICNTVKKALETYESLIEKDKKLINGLLHSRFIKKDRNKLENQVLNEKENGIWITTQIVEASLDIDFDELHTEMVPIDSLFQRCGRCYRKREYKDKEANIYIYNTKNGLNKIYDKKIYEYSWEDLQKFNNKLITEEEKLKLMNSVYDEKRIEDTDYYNDIIYKIKKIKTIYLSEYDAKEVQDLFREIYNVTIIPDAVYEENILEIEKLIDIINDKRSTKFDKIKAEQTLYNYTVSIPLYLAKTVTKISNLNIYRAHGKYDKTLGFIGGEEVYYEC